MIGQGLAEAGEDRRRPVKASEDRRRPAKAGEG